jgi:hypothetical protein
LTREIFFDAMPIEMPCVKIFFGINEIERLKKRNDSR